VNEYELLTIPCALLIVVVWVWTLDQDHEACRTDEREGGAP